MFKEDWKKVWMGLYCIVCNFDLNERIMMVYLMCLMRGIWGFDVNILMVGIV